MRKFFLFLIILISACSKKSEVKEEFNADNFKHLYSNDPLKNALIDSIILTKDTDTLVIRSDSAEYVVFSAVINNKRFGIIAITDSTLFLLQKNKNKWVQTDSIKFENYAFSFQIKDLNGDRLKDLMVEQTAYMHGNTVAVVFMADKNGHLKYVPSASNLSNMVYDKEKGLMRSIWFGGAYGTEIKELYRWVDDSLQHYRSVEYDHSGPGAGKVSFRRLIDGKIKEIKKYNSPNNTLIFDTALFQIEE